MKKILPIIVSDGLVLLLIFPRPFFSAFTSCVFVSILTLRCSIKNYSFCKLYLSLIFLSKALTNQMDLLGQLYLRAQFLFLLKLFGIFGNLILVPSSHLLTSQNHYTISSTKRSSMSGEGAKLKLHTVLVVGLGAGEVTGVKVVTCSDHPAGAGHRHLHFIGPDPALSYSGVIVLLA